MDKFDYFARDSYYLGTKISFDHMRFIKFYRVIQVDDGKRHLCLRDKVHSNWISQNQFFPCFHRKLMHVMKSIEYEMIFIDELTNIQLSKGLNWCKETAAIVCNYYPNVLGWKKQSPSPMIIYTSRIHQGERWTPLVFSLRDFLDEKFDWHILLMRCIHSIKLMIILLRWSTIHIIRIWKKRKKSSRKSNFEVRSLLTIFFFKYPFLFRNLSIHRRHTRQIFEEFQNSMSRWKKVHRRMVWFFQEECKTACQAIIKHCQLDHEEIHLTANDLIIQVRQSRDNSFISMTRENLSRL